MVRAVLSSNSQIISSTHEITTYHLERIGAPAPVLRDDEHGINKLKALTWALVIITSSKVNTIDSMVTCVFTRADRATLQGNPRSPVGFSTATRKKSQGCKDTFIRDI